MTNEVSHVPSWERASELWTTAEHHGWEMVRNLADFGAELLALKGTTPHGEYVTRVSLITGKQGDAIRQLVSRVTRLARHRDTLEERRPTSLRGALALIPATPRQVPYVAPTPAPVANPAPQQVEGPQQRPAAIAHKAVSIRPPLPPLPPVSPGLIDWVESTVDSAPTWDIAASFLDGLIETNWEPHSEGTRSRFLQNIADRRGVIDWIWKTFEVHDADTALDADGDYLYRTGSVLVPAGSDEWMMHLWNLCPYEETRYD